MASHIELKCNFSFEMINAMLKMNVKDVTLNEKLTLHQVQIARFENKIVAKTSVSGAYNGVINVSFIPRYSKAEDYLFLDNLEIKLASTSFLAKGANWMANKMFGGTIDKKFEEILNSQLGEAKKAGLEKLKHMELSPGVFFQLQNPEMDIKDEDIYDQGISCTLILDGEIMIHG